MKSRGVANIIPDLLDDVGTLMRGVKLSPNEAYEILARLRELAEATIAGVDPELEAFEGIPISDLEAVATAMVILDSRLKPKAN